VLYISHGAPTFALEPGPLGPRLRSLGETLAGRVRAVLVWSPHWQTRDLRITSGAAPVTMHDFGGFDHGAWVPLLHLFPAADVPVLQMSMPVDADARSAHALGRALAPLRERGVLIVGSGSLTHNLHELRSPGAAEADYARRFADWVAGTVLAGDAAALLDYRRRAPDAARAHPTEEHFLPLPFAAGASAAGDPVRRLEGGVTYGVLSMDAYLWGGGEAV